MAAAIGSKRRANSLGSKTALAVFALLGLAAHPAVAEAHADPTIQAAFLSDIHFEPFYDPAKAPQLAAAPVSEWKKILSTPPSADREQRFAALQQTCKARGEDTPFALFDSSLQAVSKRASGVRFATVSGDLIAHSFQCKYATLFPQAAPADFPAFVEKTIAFVTNQLAAALPGVPLYIALGNNDSGCGDYRLDAHSDFLAAVGEQVTRTLPAADRGPARQTYAAGGYMNVPLPIHDARMLVLDDLFMGAKYTTCAGKPDPAPADTQLAWLNEQLSQARRDHQAIWVMAHIPPGVDVHASVTKNQTCGAKGPTMFLANEKVAETLAAYSDVIKLAIFAHTHMDELRLLKPANASSREAGVPVKLVSSISPINGNAPSFTVAQVDEKTAGLKDFEVYASSTQTGIGAAWQQEYDWDQAYHQPAFNAAAVDKVIAGLAADAEAKTDASQAYIKNFYVGKSPLLGLVWPQYICSLNSDSAEGYKACVCPAAKP